MLISPKAKFMYKQFVLFGMLFLSGWRPAEAQSNQTDIPRINQMPDLPAPYNVRDWKSVAVQYDTFVYDINHTGQYLPLVNLQNSGYNYPQTPAFGLHTYVGTNTPNGNEAVNVLPSLVGASLCGIDKTNQFGRDWISMSRDFFSRNNGQMIYLNNKGGGSGSDWWYDLMPNVYFYQLCDLYPPAAGSVAEEQFIRIADQFLASVKALGGSETPWQKGNFDYRAFNFGTMQPNGNGVHEPEAAGAYAWVLYRAWIKTGNDAYRKAAEWAMEFLSDWGANPSYELQLPYGTLTAARMNAELGATYDVEKMLNWSFNRGPLRGWGTIVGNWGGFDASGLVGEANDAGNDYAFQLNGVQQAAALAPLVRYDKRFARAIGKWVLNLANATRLFYPGFLPGSYQDGTTWSNANDPLRVIGYEALKQNYQGISPYSTGDALNGGWAATNLSLYSSGSIGYLGAIIEKTNVDKILKINVLATDFYKAAAYPTYLYFNPYSVSKTVKLQTGNNPVDVYDALTETFLLQNASGEIDLTLPAGQARLVTLCPAGGTVTYHNNKMLVDGVVVDYSQSVHSWTRGPRIQSVAATSNEVEFGQNTELFAQVEAGASADLTYQWSADQGTVNAIQNNGEWTAPLTAGPAVITLIVTDGNNLSDTATLQLIAVPELNKPPQIQEIQKSAAYVSPGGAIQLKCIAIDPNNDPITYNWTFSGGTPSINGNTADWTAPATEGIYSVTVTASDNTGLTATANTKILVKNFAAASGNLVAYYPFSGNANDMTVNQLHGQPFGTAYVPDVFGHSNSAIYFNGVNSRVTVPLQPVLNFVDGITVSFWLRANDLPARESFPISHGSWQNRWKVSFTPEKYLRWTVNTQNAVGDLDSEMPFVTDSFYQVAVSYDGQLMAMYINGKLHSYKQLSGKIRTTTYALLIGQMLPGVTDYNYKGVLDEVKIFDYALDPQQVESLYNNSITKISDYAYMVSPLQISPNPVNDHLRCVLPGFSGKSAQFFITDINGRVLLSRIVESGETEINIALGNWESGAYIATFESKEAKSSARFIKE